MRSLVTIQKVKGISPIPDSDFLELAHVMGWQCVIKKGEFKEGELGVYFEVDSFLPIDERYEFLRASSYRDNVDNGQGFRIRSMKMRGQLSQGLLLPLEKFPELEGTAEGNAEGADVTEKLNVKKWYIPETANAGGTIIGERPYGIPASDEIRIQSALELLDELKGKPYYITTKMDGTSGIVYYIDGKIGCCSRNKEIKDEEDALYWLPVYKYGLKEKFAKLGKNLVITGEIIGPGIQKNKLRLAEIEWNVFDVKDADANRYLATMTLSKCAKSLALKQSLWKNAAKRLIIQWKRSLKKQKANTQAALIKKASLCAIQLLPKQCRLKF